MSQTEVQVRHCLKGITQVAEHMTDLEGSTFKDVVDHVRKLEQDPKVSNQEIYLYASAVFALGNALMVYTKYLGRPHETKVDPEISEVATTVLQEVGIQTIPRNRQKAIPVEEPAEEPVVEETPVEEKPKPKPKRKPRAKTKARPRS